MAVNPDLEYLHNHPQNLAVYNPTRGDRYEQILAALPIPDLAVTTFRDQGEILTHTSITPCSHVIIDTRSLPPDVAAQLIADIRTVNPGPPSRIGVITDTTNQTQAQHLLKTTFPEADQAFPYPFELNDVIKFITTTPTPSPDHRTETEPTPPGLVLVIDDDISSAESTALALELAGFQTAAVQKSEFIFPLLAPESSSIIVNVSAIIANTANMEKVLNQISYLREQGFNVHLPHLILLTGYTNPDIAEEMKEAGVDQIFYKPTDLDVIIDHLRATISQKEMPAPREISTTPRVLLVEDSEETVILTYQLIKFLGLNVDMDSVPDGQAALELLKRGFRYDLLLIDELMPRMNGSKLVRTILETPELAKDIQPYKMIIQTQIAPLVRSQSLADLEKSGITVLDKNDLRGNLEAALRLIEEQRALVE